MLGISNSNVTMKFVQIHCFLSQNIGGTKDIVSPMSKSCGVRVPLVPLKLGPRVCVLNLHEVSRSGDTLLVPGFDSS